MCVRMSASVCARRAESMRFGGWQAEQRHEGKEKGAEGKLGFEHMERMKEK